MKTVAEILKESGLTDEQITALDAKAMSGFTAVVSTAQQTLDAAELAKRAQTELYDKEIAPALDNWANERAGLQTKVAAFEAALKAAKEGGFQIPEILNTPGPTKGPDGKFVAGGNEVPGSPKFETLQSDLANAFSFVADTSWKYRTLYGAELPDAPTTIIREAATQRMSPSDYAAKKYDFAGKEAAKRADDQKKHDDKIRADALAENDKKWAEKIGTNPNLRVAQESAFSTVNKAVAAGERKDPLSMSKEERHAATRNIIRKEIAENDTVQ